MAKSARKETIGEMVRGCVMEPGEQWIGILEVSAKTVDDLTLHNDEVMDVRATAGALAAFAKLQGRRRDHARLAALTRALRDRHYALVPEVERQWMKAHEHEWNKGDAECGAVFAVWCDLGRACEARGISWREMMNSGFPDEAQNVAPLSKAEQRSIVANARSRFAAPVPRIAETTKKANTVKCKSCDRFGLPVGVVDETGEAERIDEDGLCERCMLLVPACADCGKSGTFINKDGRCAQCERNHRASLQRVERLEEAAPARVVRRSA
jgi:hypothetical protein